jgi:hypothetical protein
MSAQTDALLAELLDVQRRMLTAQEQVVATQLEMIARHRRLVRRSMPLLAVFGLAAVGPYLWNLVAYFVNR